MVTLPKETLLALILEKCADFEFDTFVLGILNTEKYPKPWIRTHFHDLKVFLGLTLSDIWKHRKVHFTKPEARINFCPFRGEVKIETNPLFLAGRYLKLSRNITSSYWVHHACHGKGCPSCAHRGSQFDFSIEEFIDQHVRVHFRSKDRKFHAMGREDIDVLMLGQGRPFIFEIYQPQKRSILLENLLEAMKSETRTKISYLKYVDADSVTLLKNTEPAKIYQAQVECNATLPQNLLEKLSILQGYVLLQKTPLRVINRRVDKFRKRTVFKITVDEIQTSSFTMTIHAEAGTYIKELISGDQGRTQPSVSSILEMNAKCVQLDVLDIVWTAPWEI